MRTQIFNKTDTNSILEVLRQGGVVAFPTDTVYGLAIKSSDEIVMKSLFSLKERIMEKPFPLMVSSWEMLEEVVEMDFRTKSIAQALLPGPITLVLNKKETAFSYLKNKKTLAIRMADEPWLVNIIDTLNEPLWLTSANLSNYPEEITHMGVLKQFDGLIGGIIKGKSGGLKPSSIFDLTKDSIEVLREGELSIDDVHKMLKNHLEKESKFDSIKNRSKENDMRDDAVFKAIENEEIRQIEHIELIASENFVSKDILEVTGSVLTNKYAEGYPGKRYYGGCENVDEIETLAIERLKKLFNAEHANVQPHSGSQANMAVYMSILEHGDVVLGMDLNAGGHLTHGHQLNFSGVNYTFFSYGVDPQTEQVNYDEVLSIAKRVKPKLIVAGASAYARTLDFNKFREIADEVDAYLMVDMAHIAGLVAAGLHPSPVGVADFVTSTTHKTLRGPRGGIILCKEEFASDIDRSVFPGIQGGPLMHIIAGKAVCFYEALQPSFIDYQKQVLKNVQALADELKKLGFRLVSGGSDNHLLLVDLKNSINMTGKHAELILEKVGITVNKNAIPFDTERPFVTSGIRLGAPAMTTRGFKEEEFKKVAHWIYDALTNYEDEARLKEIEQEVKSFTKKYPSRGEEI